MFQTNKTSQAHFDLESPGEEGKKVKTEAKEEESDEAGEETSMTVITVACCRNGDLCIDICMFVHLYLYITYITHRT